MGKDVATALGYAKSENALATHVDNEDKADTLIQGDSQRRRMTIINESGLYSLVLSSRNLTARCQTLNVNVSCDVVTCDVFRQNEFNKSQYII